jgi:hypothetical protein
MARSSNEEEQVGPGGSMLWGFLSTLLLGVIGFIAALAGAWPLLWLPLLAPVFAFAYGRLRLHSRHGFGRFLAGYGICLTVFIALMIAYLAFAV